MLKKSLFIFVVMALVLGMNPSISYSESSLELLDVENRCNGGECETPGGDVLECPTHGGPICEEGASCSCECMPNEPPDGGYWTRNTCSTTYEF